MGIGCDEIDRKYGVADAGEGEGCAGSCADFEGKGTIGTPTEPLAQGGESLVVLPGSGAECHFEVAPKFLSFECERAPGGAYPSK